MKNKYLINAIYTTLSGSPRMGDGEEEGGDEGDKPAEGDTPVVNSIDTNSQEFKDAVTKAVGSQVSGLKSKNSELIAREKAALETAKKFEGLDLEKIQNMTTMIEQDERMKLLAEGKFDEVLQKETDTITANFKSQITELNTKYEASSANELKYKKRRQTKRNG